MKLEGNNKRDSILYQNLKAELDVFFNRINDALENLACRCRASLVEEISKNDSQENPRKTNEKSVDKSTNETDINNKVLLENFEAIVKDLKLTLKIDACKCTTFRNSENSSNATFYSLSECSDLPTNIPVGKNKRLTLLERAYLNPLTLSDLFPREITEPDSIDSFFLSNPCPPPPIPSVPLAISPAQSFYSAEYSENRCSNLSDKKCKCLVDEIVQTYGESKITYGIYCDGQIESPESEPNEAIPLIEVRHKKFICGDEEEKIKIRIKFKDERYSSDLEEGGDKEETDASRDKLLQDNKMMAKFAEELILNQKDTKVLEPSKMRPPNQLQQKIYSSNKFLCGMQMPYGINQFLRPEKMKSDSYEIEEKAMKIIDNLKESNDYNISYGTTDDVVVHKPLVVQEDGKIKIYIPLNSDVN